MGNCHLNGEIGDRLHAVLCAAGYHIQWLLRMMARKGTSFVRRDYLRLCTVAGVSPNWQNAMGTLLTRALAGSVHRTVGARF